MGDDKLQVCDMGRAAYEAFVAELRKTVDPEKHGQKIAPWDDLEYPFKIAWATAAQASFDHFIAITAGLRKVPT